MKFSLILNSRKRSRFLYNFINSLVLNTEDKSKAEILIRIDDDDDESLKLTEQNFNFNVKFYCGKRPLNLHKTINELALNSEAENIFVCNDDIEIITKNWDSLALAKIENYKKENKIKDNIYYCKTNCNSADRDRLSGYCSFPIISKEAVKELGFFMHESFVGLGADHCIYRLYKSIDRVIDLTELNIDHVLHRNLNDVFNPDATAQEMRDNSSRNWIDPKRLDISKEIEKLKSKINESK